MAAKNRHLFYIPISAFSPDMLILKHELKIRKNENQKFLSPSLYACHPSSG